MNARRPDDDLERLLADDGGELGALYRRLPRAEPPRRLDRTVLAEATRAVHGSRPRGPRWLVGFGSVAGLVLAAGIAWHVGHEGLRDGAPVPRDDNPAWVPVTPLDESAVHHAPAAPAAAETQAPAAAAPTAAPPAAPTPPMRKPAAPAPARDAMKMKARSEEPVASPPPPPAAPVAAPAASDTFAPSPAAGAAQAKQSQAADTTADAERAAPAEAAPLRRARRSGPSPTTSVELRRDTQLAPDAWLAHIRQLLHQGRRQQAIESLQLFRRAHPDWTLPAELQDLAD